MSINQTEDWLDRHCERFPLADPHEFTSEEYPEGLGIQLCIPEKADFLSSVSGEEEEQRFRAYVRRKGVCRIRFLDDETFVDQMGTREATRAHPGFSLPFHIDVTDPTTSRPTSWDQWTWGVQGLYQNPGAGRKGIDTVIAPVIAVALTLDSILKPSNDFLDPRFLEYLEGSLESEVLRAPEGSCEATVLVMALDIFSVNHQTWDREMGLIELVNQELFKRTPQLVRTSWDEAELCQGGMALFWDAGTQGDPSRELAHGRDNKGNCLSAAAPNIYRVSTKFNSKSP